MAVATVDEYLANLEGELHDVTAAARRLILDELPELDDPDGVLEGSGTKMAHVKLMAPADLDEELLRGWLRQAADLARG